MREWGSSKGGAGACQRSSSCQQRCIRATLYGTVGCRPCSHHYSPCVQERYQAREAILEMRENAVAAKEDQALVREAAHASSASQAFSNGHSETPTAQDTEHG